MKKCFVFLVVVSVLLVSSCSQTGYVKTGPGSAPPIVGAAAGSVQVFQSEADLPAGAVKLGVVNVRGWQANTAWILQALKVRAWAEGGNAIVLVKVNPKGLFTYSYGTGEALVFKLEEKNLTSGA